jgi:hypothetical protein
VSDTLSTADVRLALAALGSTGFAVDRLAATIRSLAAPTDTARVAAERLGIEMSDMRRAGNRQRRIDSALLREEIARRKMEKRRAAHH